MKILKKIIFVVITISALTTLSLFASCATDDDSEYVSCGSGPCDSATPYSNEYASNCYASQSDCESATGHACKNCN
jgi:hypothetical protein